MNKDATIVLLGEYLHKLHELAKMTDNEIVKSAIQRKMAQTRNEIEHLNAKNRK